MTLYEAGQPVPAVPLVRLMVEDAVTAGWLLLFPEKHRPFLRNGADERRKLFEETLRVDPTLEDAAVELAEAQRLLDELAGSGGYKIQQVIEDLFPGGNLYAIYRVLTGESHAGVGVVDLYIVDDPTSPIGVSYRPVASVKGAAGVIGTAAAMLLQTMIAWDSVLEDRQWQKELTDLATRMQVQTEWARPEPADSLVKEPL